MKYQYRFILIITLLLAITTLAVVLSSRSAFLKQTENQGLALAKALGSAVQFTQRVPDRVDTIIGNQMINQARIASQLVRVAKQAGMSDEQVSALLKEIVKTSSVNEFWVTDGNGKTVITTVDEGLGFTFSSDPNQQPQAYEFHQLLDLQNGAVAQKAQPRSLDGKMFKFVGVSGTDEPRIVQVGNEASFLTDLAKDINLQALMDSMVELEEVQAIVLKTGDQVISSTDGSLSADQVADKSWETVTEKAMERNENQTEWFNNQIRIVTPLGEVDGQPQGTITLYMSTAAANAAIQNMLFLVGGVSIGILLLGILLATWIAKDVTQPLKTLTNAAVCLSQGDTQLTGIDPQQIARLNARKDEMGAAGKAFQQLTSYLNEMSSVADRLGEGDLMVKVAPHGSSDHLGNAFNRMAVSLGVMVSQILDSAHELDAASVELSSSTGQARQATLQIGATIHKIAQGASQQTEGTGRTLQVVGGMASAIQAVAHGSTEQAAVVQQVGGISGSISSVVQKVVDSTFAQGEGLKRASETTQMGARVIQESIQGMEKIQNKMALSTQKMAEMSSHSEQIGAIVETIDDIASQTNLLALNAAIEAARAGEGGKGFAVVADEVRKLAEKSALATKEIAGLVQQIQASIAETMKAMNESAAEVKNGVGLANQSGAAMTSVQQAAEVNLQHGEDITCSAREMSTLAEELAEEIATVSRVIQENTVATEQMLSNSTTVSHSVENIASVSMENSASVEEVALAIQSVDNQVEVVTLAAQSLTHLSQQLLESVRQFKVSAS